ncbi:Hsp70 family protein [Lacunimicrobium album]
MILRRLRENASHAIGQSITRAVITVPAFFDENQRQATREAAELAGLTAERIINEPTAATLVYHAGTQDRKQIAVYDFGGGTFDVSIVRMEAGITEVLSSRGDVRLGGDDLDQVLLDHIAEQFLSEHGIDLRENATSRYRLSLACEQAKRRLSFDETVRIEEEFITEKAGQPLHLTATVTRSEFEELIEPFIERTIDCLDAALREAGMTVHQMDDLVLVGGSTRIPLVEKRLREEFQREPSRAVDSDLAVALGAAVQAAMIEGRHVGPVLVDVTGHTLGIEACVGMTFSGPQMVFSPIIHRNTPLPARYEHAYSTMFDGQKAVEIHVLQGEHPEVHRNRSIGKFRLDLEGADKERSKITVRFELTLDGTLKVTATQTATGLSRQLEIDNALSHFQADERSRAQARLEEMFDESDEFASQGNPLKSTDIDADSPAPADSELAEETFAEAIALLKKADAARKSL